jgi:NAD-dependent dihydropyrimidine dehydrogenase PreA subunit
MSGRSYLGIPRALIPWYPSVDADKCIGCGECLDACPNGVFVLDDAAGKMVVAVPDNCVVLCDKCAALCSTDAIAFPDKTATKQLLRRLLEEMAPHHESQPRT